MFLLEIKEIIFFTYCCCSVHIFTSLDKTKRVRGMYMKVMILHYFWNSKPFEKVISNCSRGERLWKETDI